MSLLDQIQEDTKTALKAGQKETVQALRMLSSDLKNAAIDGNADEVGVLQSARKKRLDAAQQFRDAGRAELADAEQREAELIQRYLPEQIGEAELTQIIKDAIDQTGASSPKDMGQVMKAVMSQTKGRADGSQVSALVKEQLAS
jgi:uncharacterized protein YqeY